MQVMHDIRSIRDNPKDFDKALGRRGVNAASEEILKILDNQTHIQIVNQSLTNKIYKLFPYSSPNYDPQLSRDEALNSLKNLNTRLLNLQKINKSLDTFIKESNQLNWEDLQKINIEITNED